LWDLSKEKSSRIFSTGNKASVTSFASCEGFNTFYAASHTTSSSSRGGSFGDSASSDGSESGAGSGAGGGAGGGGDNQWTWLLAGFSDGCIGVFDERVDALGGQVHSMRGHDSWIVGSFLRRDLPHVLTGSSEGVVKFWDIRNLRAFKQREVVKGSTSPLTAMAVHDKAPIMAVGSRAQFVKLLTYSGEQLGMIRYHDGFLGQRIAPITCLGFHPSKLQFAAGATDSIISVYSTSSEIVGR
jgi:WD40 repeat protein